MTPDVFDLHSKLGQFSSQALQGNSVTAECDKGVE